MAIMDAQLLFSDAQALTAAAASTNYINLSAARDIANGHPLLVRVSIDVALTDAGSNSTVTVSARWDSTTTFTPDATQDLFIIPALAAAGATYWATLPPHIATTYQYMQLYYTMNNGDLSTGTVTSGIVIGGDKWTAYADAITIS